VKEDSIWEWVGGRNNKEKWVDLEIFKRSIRRKGIGKVTQISVLVLL
jgi:hypothetical protein